MTSIAFAMRGGLSRGLASSTPVLTRVHFATSYAYAHVMLNPSAWRPILQESEEEIER
jgi:hypothetical protein